MCTFTPLIPVKLHFSCLFEIVFIFKILFEIIYRNFKKHFVVFYLQQKNCTLKYKCEEKKFIILLNSHHPKESRNTFMWTLIYFLCMEKYIGVRRRSL